MRIGAAFACSYRIVVRSDGYGFVSAPGITAHYFPIPGATTARFFEAAAASKLDNFKAAACPKSPPPLESVVHVSYRGWRSPDMTCMPESNDPRVLHDGVMLNNAVMEIAVYAGPPAAIPRREISWPQP